MNKTKSKLTIKKLIKNSNGRMLKIMNYATNYPIWIGSFPYERNYGIDMPFVYRQIDRQTNNVKPKYPTSTLLSKAYNDFDESIRLDPAWLWLKYNLEFRIRGYCVQRLFFYPECIQSSCWSERMILLAYNTGDNASMAAVDWRYYLT